MAATASGARCPGLPPNERPAYGHVEAPAKPSNARKLSRVAPVATSNALTWDAAPVVSSTVADRYRDAAEALGGEETGELGAAAAVEDLDVPARSPGPVASRSTQGCPLAESSGRPLR